MFGRILSFTRPAEDGVPLGRQHFAVMNIAENAV